MGELKQYEIYLPSLSDGHHELEMHVDGSFFKENGNNDVSDADVDIFVDINVRREVYSIGITCQGWIQIPCDRCLDPMRHEVDDDYDFIVRYGDDYDEADDSITLPQNETVLDLKPMISDTILLSIPLRHVHPDGLCNPEMEKFMEEHTSEGTDPDDDI